MFFYVNGSDARGRSVSENRVLEIHEDGTVGAAVKVPLKEPLSNSFTATVRAGSPASRTIEILGTQQGTGTTISFARIRVE
ncbi:MAG: hypothetical protein GY809_11635 [Planctomycetes bacterium]|nr:hypothetical protein [Planctomycetota bacterium]